MSCGQAGDLQAHVAARVGGEHRGAAGIGHHGDPVSLGYRLRGQQRRGVEELAEVGGGDHAGLLEQGLPGEGGCHRCVGAGCGQAPACRGPAHVHGQDRLGTADAAGGAGELAGVPERLQVQHGQLGRRVRFPPQQHVVAGHVVFVAQRDERGDADAQPGQVLQQHDADAAGLQRQAGLTRQGMTGGERRVQGHAGAGHAEGGGPDQPHAVAAADAPQLRAGRTVQARRDHHQGPGPPPPALPGDTGYGSRRRGNDRQVDLFGQRGRRWHAPDAVQLGRARVDRADRAGEVAADDVLQDGPADRPGAPARADDRDRGRGQHVPQARHAGGPLPLGDRVAVGAEGGVGLAGGQREGEVVHTVGQGAVHRQPGVGEHLQHERVLAERLRGEGVDSPAAGQRDQVLQQQGADAAAVHVIGDRHGDLSGPGAIAENLIAAAADHFPVQHSQQRGVIRCRLAADPVRLLLGRKRADAEETQIEIVRGHPGVHVPHRLEVTGPRGPDLDRGAVGQQSVGVGLGPCAHVALPGISALPQGLFSRSLICRRGQQTGPRCGVPHTRSSASAGLRASRSALEYGSTEYDTPARPRPIRCRDRYRHRPRPPGSSDVLHFQPSLRAPGQPGTKGPHCPARGSAEIDSLWERIGFRIDGPGILRCPLGQPGAYLMAERAGWPSTGTLGAVFYDGRTSPAKRHGQPT